MSTIIFGLREVYHNEDTMWIMWSEEGEGRDCMGSMMFSGLHKFFPLWQHYVCVWRRKWVTCMSSNKMFSGLSEVYHHNEDTIICFMVVLRSRGSCPSWRQNPSLFSFAHIIAGPLKMELQQPTCPSDGWAHWELSYIPSVLCTHSWSNCTVPSRTS